MRNTFVSGRRAVVVALLLALVSLGFAAPASAQGGEEFEDVKMNKFVDVRTNKTAAVVMGDTAWVTVSIRGKEDVDDVRFTATLSDGSVVYPENTVGHSGPNNGYRIDDKETDYVAFQVTIPADFDKKDIKLELEATWTHEGTPMRGTDDVKIPLVEFDGSPYTLENDTVTVSEEANGWVEVSFVGLAPRLENFEVAIAEPGALGVYYPLDTFTSLDGDALLEDGETDVVRFRLDEAHWGDTIEAVLEVRYTFADVGVVANHDLMIEPA